MLAAQLGFDFARVALGQRGGPLRRQPGVHHHPAELAVDVHQFLHAQPRQQFRRVLREQHVLQIGVDLALVVRRTLADHQQRQVVVAQHHIADVAQRMHQAQGLDRLPAAVDQVAAEPQPVHRRIETKLLQQALGDVVATLQVADCPSAHRS